MVPAETRDVLTRARDGLRSELDELTAAPRDPMAAVSFGKRVGEGTTQAVERIAQVDAAKHLDAKLRDVERALAKLEEGTYGRLRRLRRADRDRTVGSDPVGRAMCGVRSGASVSSPHSAGSSTAIHSDSLDPWTATATSGAPTSIGSFGAGLWIHWVDPPVAAGRRSTPCPGPRRWPTAPARRGWDRPPPPSPDRSGPRCRRDRPGPTPPRRRPRRPRGCRSRRSGGRSRRLSDRSGPPGSRAGPAPTAIPPRTRARRVKRRARAAATRRRSARRTPSASSAPEPTHRTSPPSTRSVTSPPSTRTGGSGSRVAGLILDTLPVSTPPVNQTVRSATASAIPPKDVGLTAMRSRTAPVVSSIAVRDGREFRAQVSAHTPPSPTPSDGSTVLVAPSPLTPLAVSVTAPVVGSIRFTELGGGG